MAKLESFAYAGEVPDDSVGIARAIQHGDYVYIIVASYTIGGWRWAALRFTVCMRIRYNIDPKI